MQATAQWAKYRGEGGTGQRPQKLFVPKSGVNLPSSLMNFLFFLRKIVLWVDGSDVGPKPPPPPRKSWPDCMSCPKLRSFLPDFRKRPETAIIQHGMAAVGDWVNAFGRLSVDNNN